MFLVEGDNSQQPPLEWNTRDIPVSYGVEIFTDDYLDLLQYTHLTDERTDEQNCDSNTMCCITCSRTVIMLPMESSFLAIYGLRYLCGSQASC